MTVPPDVSLCGECARELFDASNRRFRYPFTSCKECGPRFAIVRAMPLARERTTMGAFEQCHDCRYEFRDPDDRRHRAVANSCPVCGPNVRYQLAGDNRTVARGVEAIRYAARDLLRGRIVAIRGLGGFELAVDAMDDDAVRRLRDRKARDARPFAVMVRAVSDARKLAELGTETECCLSSSERPTLLLERRDESGLAASVAPGLARVAVRLPFTPLQVLLMEFVKRPIATTSGRLGDEPVVTSKAEAVRRLGSVADRFLLHDREIVTRCDDSLLRVVGGAPLFHRRARGYVPLPTALPISTPRPLVAVGPQNGNTFTLASDRTAYVSQPIGDLRNLETIACFQESLETFRRLFAIEPEVVVQDLYAGSVSVGALGQMGLEAAPSVQHHHAHLAAVTAEHGWTERVVGVVFDGGGVGPDDSLWGAEILVADLCEYDRRATLRPAPLPGGEVAAKQPWRAALGYLSLEPDAARAFDSAFEGVDASELPLAQRQIDHGIDTPVVSSMGRLFDAAAAVLGVRRVSQYEAQAAMELEALAGSRVAEPLPFPMSQTDAGLLILDPIPLLVALGERRAAGDDLGDLAARLHESIAWAYAELARQMADHTGIAKVVLSGGVFMNARLLASMLRRLEAHILEPVLPRVLPPNNGAVSYGQVAVAAARMSALGSS
jgi:hydrogenase maturation protein HypF